MPETCQTARFENDPTKEAGFQDQRALKDREVRGGISAWLQGLVQIVWQMKRNGFCKSPGN